MSLPENDRLCIGRLVSFFFFFYLVFYQGIRTGDGYLLYMVTQNLVRNQKVEVPLRKENFTYPGRGGRYFSKFGPGISLLAVPFYIAGDIFSKRCRGPAAAETVRQWFVSLLSPVMSVTGLAFFGLYLRRRSHSLKKCCAWMLVLGLGSPLAVYSGYFEMTAVASGLLLCMLYFADAPCGGREALGLCLTGFWGTLVRLELGIAFLVFAMLYYYRHRRASLIAALPLAGFGLTVLLCVGFNYYKFGSLLSVPYDYRFRSILAGMKVLFFHPYHSLFLYFPLMVYVAYRLLVRGKEILLDPLLLVTTVIFLAYLVLYAAWDGIIYHISWGNRLMVPATILLGAAFAGTRGNAVRSGTLFFWGVLGFLINLPGLLFVTVNFRVQELAGGKQMSLLEILAGKAASHVGLILSRGPDLYWLRFRGGEILLLGFLLLAGLFFVLAFYRMKKEAGQPAKGK